MLKKYLTSLVVLTLLMFSFSACKVKKINQNYLSRERPDSSHARVWQDYEVSIQKRDKLSIYITALNSSAANIYNIGGGGAGTGSDGRGQGYIVDNSGNIVMPQLGTIRVEGYSRNQLRDTLVNRLKTYLTDPVVFVDFMNLKVTVLGEVASKGSISLNDGKKTLLEVLGEAGDITSDGQRDSILVIREVGGKREFGHVNLLSNNAFKSPYFILQQNDVIYVPMQKEKAIREERESFVQRVLPVITVLTSITSLVWVVYSITR